MTQRMFSLAAKLRTLGVNDTIFLPDNAPLMGPTQMERQVQDRIRKTPTLKDRKFRTSRCDTITAGRKLVHTLLVERME